MDPPTDPSHWLSKVHPSARFLEDQEPYLQCRTSIRSRPPSHNFGGAGLIGACCPLTTPFALVTRL
jgi:hypothetical protein